MAFAVPVDLTEIMRRREARRQPARLLRLSGIAIATLVLGLGSFATLVPIGGAVIASGRVGVQSRVKRVSHPAGGVIAHIYVQNGDLVREGQPLLSFDDKVSSSEAEFAGLTVAQLLATRARLEAELRGAKSIAFPAELTSGVAPGAEAAMEAEQRLFAIRRSEAAGITAQIEARILQYRKQIEGFRAQIASLQKQQALIGPELEGIRELWKKRLVTISRVNQIERTAAELEGRIASLHADIAQTQAQVTETEEQLIQIRQTRRSAAAAELANVNGTLNQQRARSVSVGDVQDRTIVRTPYSGLVDKLAFAAVGDVIRPAETIMVIVPNNDRLLIEGAIKPSDIDQVEVGQVARVRFTAFNRSTTPELLGRVTFVAPDLATDPDTSAPFFALRIQIDTKTFPDGRKINLKPGMPAEIFLGTGSRSMASYLLKPIKDQLHRSFRDNH